MIKAFVLLVLVMSLPLATSLADQPEAIGKVTWGRHLETALAASKQSGKPVFALFQEVPGCAGCRQFGRDVLSHPVLVSAIESEFIPLLIHNNSSGDSDTATLARFHEPAWNYQVVRFLDSGASDLIPRKDQIWETGPLAERMITALKRTRRPVPAYLPLIAQENSPRLKQAVFSMYCFWTGEMELGKIDGVVTTEAGFHGGREVTLVHYDPAIISLPRLIAAGEKVQCAHAVHVPSADFADSKASRLTVGIMKDYRAAPADDQKKQLSGTFAARLSMTPAQTTKVNAWIRVDAAKALGFLTPSQRAQAGR